MMKADNNTLQKTELMKRTYALLVLLIGTVSCFINSASAQETPASKPTSRVVEDGGTGPFKAIMVSERSLPTHTVFKPSDLGTATKKNKLPVIVWGNGACANSPWEHVNFLSEVASYGFMVIAIGPMPQEGERTRERSTSSQLTDAINWAVAQNKDKASPYIGKLDVKKIAVSGMSCGGLQALETAPDPRVATTV